MFTVDVKQQYINNNNSILRTFTIGIFLASTQAYTTLRLLLSILKNDTSRIQPDIPAIMNKLIQFIRIDESTWQNELNCTDLTLTCLLFRKGPSWYGCMDDLQLYVRSTVFQLYLDDVWVIKAVCNGTLFTGGKIFASSGARTLDR